MSSPYSQLPTIDTSPRKRTFPSSDAPSLSLKTSSVMIPITITEPACPRFIKFIGRGPDWSEDGITSILML